MNSADKNEYVYIMSSPDRTALYLGVTSDLRGRVWQHKNKFYPKSFSAKYNCTMLVYYCNCGSMLAAIAEEKRLKGGSRQQKIDLIVGMNYDWLIFGNKYVVISVACPI